MMLVGGKEVGKAWIHVAPHPEEVCRCTTPEPWVRGEDIREKKKSLVNAGISTYSGGVQKEGYSE